MATPGKSTPTRLKIAVLELFPTPEGKLKHPGAENVKRALLPPSSSSPHVYLREGARRAMSSTTTSIEPPSLPFVVRLITANQMTVAGGRAFFENGFAAIVIPGGSSGQQAKALGEAGRAVIRRFVAAGGGYVGICAGAYLGCKGWLDVLPECSVVDFEHWSVPCVEINQASRRWRGGRTRQEF